LQQEVNRHDPNNRLVLVQHGPTGERVAAHTALAGPFVMAWASLAESARDVAHLHEAELHEAELIR
jgi:hypothetical protein